MGFLRTKYMGSKQSVLPFIMDHLSRIKYDTVLDPFAGSVCVAYALKRAGKRVIANDCLRFVYHTAKATIENDSTTLEKDDVARLLERNRKAGYFIQRTFAGLYFSDDDCAFLDNCYANIETLGCPMKRSLALAAICRACMKKRPRGIFTFVGQKGWDGRKDLRLSMREQFIRAVKELNGVVFSNGRRNRAMCEDVFDVSHRSVDLVYIDTPYVTPHSDCDYTRRYHFVEGLCTYWRDLSIQTHTVTKKIESRPTAFKSAKTIQDSFVRLFHHFRDCKLVVSYGSNGIPSRDAMVTLLREFKRNVTVAEIPHRYCFGNHHHKVGNNNNNGREYLFIAI